MLQASLQALTCPPTYLTNDVPGKLAGLHLQMYMSPNLCKKNDAPGKCRSTYLTNDALGKLAGTYLSPNLSNK